MAHISTSVFCGDAANDMRLCVNGFVALALGDVDDVQHRIAADPRVFGVYDVTGEMDSLIIVRVQDREDLNDFTKTVLSSEGVVRSVTHVVLNTVKEDTVRLPPD